MRDIDLTETLRQPTPVRLSRESLEATLALLLDAPLRADPPIFSSPAVAEQYARLVRGESDPKE